MILFGKKLHKNCLPLIIAEISCNHEGSLSKAHELTLQAKLASADAVKIQVYIADDMTINYQTNPDSNHDFWVKDGPWKCKHLYHLYEETGTPYEWLPDLFQYARNINIPLFASVFSLKGLAALEEQNCPTYKIASFELPDIYLIEKVAKTNKPIILSTGMADLNEINKAICHVDLQNIILMHCVSAYPTKLENANLWRINQLRTFYNVPVGFSDHTTGMFAAQYAVAMGARIIEKHFGFDDTNSEDKTFSFGPDAFKRYAEGCRRAAEATFKNPTPEEESSRQFRRSLYIVKDIKQGEIFTMDNVRSIRPSYGLSPSMLMEVITKKATYNIKAGTALKREDLS